MSLHLHSIADAEHGSSIVIAQESPQEFLEKKLKKGLTIKMKWDIKG